MRNKADLNDGAQDKSELIIESAIYEQIFRIFEDELEEIGRFVAFTDANSNTCSTKIHELHLRVCSEVENVLKIIVHRHFVSEGDINTKWSAWKSAFLDKKGARLDYEALRAKLNAQDGRNLDRLLYGHPDFAFYYKLACEHFRVNQKKIQFKAGVSDGNRWKTMTPFSSREGADVPDWWTQYNKLKHDKISAYADCTLGDLGNAMGALYLLMNYLTVYQIGNASHQDVEYSHFRKNGGRLPYGPLNCAYSSIFFEPTTLVQNAFLAVYLPESVSEDQFEKTPATSYHPWLLKQVQFFPESWDSLGGPLKDAKLDSVEWGHPEDSAQMIFYRFLDYQRVSDIDSKQVFRRLGCFSKFCN